MKIKELHESDVTVLEISGRLDGANDNVKLMSAVKSSTNLLPSFITIGIRTG